MNHELKPYQQESLQHLKDYLALCTRQSPAQAFAQLGARWLNPNNLNESVPPYHARFGEGVPCVCLRVPTGGGKTLMGAHAVAIAGQSYLGVDFPVALWLTPTDTIRSQTLAALSSPQHPYRQALAGYFGDRVRVCDLETINTLQPGDVGQSAIIIVSTIQALSVRDTKNRNVYAFVEALSPHFAAITSAQAQPLDRVNEKDLIEQPHLTAADVGRVKHSLANWLSLQRPILMMDEAHNHQTEVFRETVRRIGASCVIEFTATPVHGINVLHHVSALALKADHMIKMPVVLSEQQLGWQQCLHDARLTRERLEILAQKETDYVRPIMLIQAQDKNGHAHVEAVRQYLIESELIAPEQIAVATGQQKELDGVNLFDPSCPVRFVITVEALKEGWDCSFAYVLAGLQSVESAKDVEQLLGRVLRMPYARQREQPELNKSYAHIVAQSFAQAASRLKDRMVQNMGFDPMDASLLFKPAQQPLDMPGGRVAAELIAPELVVDLSGTLKTEWLENLPTEVKQVTQVKHNSVGATLVMQAHTPLATLVQARAYLEQVLPKAQATSAVMQISEYLGQVDALHAPAQRGIAFATLPQLCLDWGDVLQVADKTVLAGVGQIDLLAEKVQLAQFDVLGPGHAFEIDIKNQGLQMGQASDAQAALDLAHVQSLTETDLMRWLDKEVAQPDIAQPQLQKWLLLMLRHLQHERHFTLPDLVRSKFKLASALVQELERQRQLAAKKGFQASLPGMITADMRQYPALGFRYDPEIYPAKSFYQGSYEFKKHFYGNSRIGDLTEKLKDGKDAEEFMCARAIDAHPMVRHWVRNIARQERHSFWLPTSDDHFYPDFVAELTDGRVLVVEYKGENIKTADDAVEKNAVGLQWEQAMGGQGLFLMAVLRYDDGRDVMGQLNHKLGL